MREQEDLSCLIAKSALFFVRVSRERVRKERGGARGGERFFLGARNIETRRTPCLETSHALPDGTFLSLVRVLLKTREHDAALCSHERPGNSELAHRSSHAFVVAPPHG
jgi:hypothetical protein